MKPEKEERKVCHTQPIETAHSCVIPKAGSMKNQFLLKSPCGATAAGSVFSRGREDPEEKPRKRDKEDEEPRGKKSGRCHGGVRTDSDFLKYNVNLQTGEQRR